MSMELKVGDSILVPWGLDEPLEATVVEVWGDPAHHVRVQLSVGEADGEPGPVILVSPDILLPGPASVR